VTHGAREPGAARRGKQREASGVCRGSYFGAECARSRPWCFA
jgi:hypothetical protein